MLKKFWFMHSNFEVFQTLTEFGQHKCICVIISDVKLKKNSVRLQNHIANVSRRTTQSNFLDEYDTLESLPWKKRAAFHMRGKKPFDDFELVSDIFLKTNAFPLQFKMLTSSKACHALTFSVSFNVFYLWERTMNY
jgi:hypothetical protein